MGISESDLQQLVNTHQRRPLFSGCLSEVREKDMNFKQRLI